MLPFQAAGWLTDLLKSNGADVTFVAHGSAHDLGPFEESVGLMASFLAVVKKP